MWFSSIKSLITGVIDAIDSVGMEYINIVSMVLLLAAITSKQDYCQLMDACSFMMEPRVHIDNVSSSLIYS